MLFCNSGGFHEIMLCTCKKFYSLEHFVLPSLERKSYPLHLVYYICSVKEGANYCLQKLKKEVRTLFLQTNCVYFRALEHSIVC